MMSTNYNMRNAGSSVDLPKQKVRVRGLGRGFRSKNKRQSPPASSCGSSTNVLATRLKTQMEAAQNNRTRDKVAHSRVNHHQLLFGSGADPSVSAQAGVGILTSPRLADFVSDWILLGPGSAF